MPGPAPQAVVRRQNKLVVTSLPATGRTGPPPRWPLSKMIGGELAVWRDLWSTPQAVAWERLGWSRTVARLCRCLAAAERPMAPFQYLAEARQLEDRLGLTPMSMSRLRWAVADEKPTVETSGNVVTPDRWQRSAG